MLRAPQRVRTRGWWLFTNSQLGLPTPEPTGLPTPEPTIPSPASTPDTRTGTISTSHAASAHDGTRDTVVVDTGFSDKESLPQPDDTTTEHLDPSPGSSGAALGEVTPTAGARPAEGQPQQRQRRRAAEIYGTEPTRRSSRPPQPNRRYPPPSFKRRLGPFFIQLSPYGLTWLLQHRSYRSICRTRLPSITRRQTKSFFTSTLLASCRLSGCNRSSGRDASKSGICRRLICLQTDLRRRCHGNGLSTSGLSSVWPTSRSRFSVQSSFK